MIETKFKHTDIGLIPEDWEVRHIGDFASIKSGGTITAKSFVNDGLYPVYGGNGIRGSINEYNLDAGYLLIGRVGALCGNIHINKEKCFASEHALICYPLKSYSVDFVAPIMRKMNLGQYSGASAQPVLAAKKLESLQMVFPPIEEQERIGKALSDVDKLIDSLSKLVEKKRAIKKGAMEQLLTGKLRLPGFSEPWETMSLDEFGYLIPNNSLSWEMLSNRGNILNIHYGDLLTRFNDVLDVENSVLPFVDSAYECKFNKKERVKDGDVIFADTAEDDTVGKAIEVINVASKEVVSGLHTFWFRPQIEFAKGFLGYAMNSVKFHSQIPPLATGTKVSSISKPYLLKLVLHYPSSIVEQEAIANILTDMDKEISALEAKLEKYKKVKQGMMQQLLTGKIRLI